MLTNEQIGFIEMAVRTAKDQKESMFELSTFAIDGLCNDIRTLQQQNKQLIESIDNIVHVFDWDDGKVRNYNSGILLEEKAQESIKNADKLIQSIQGGGKSDN